MSEAASPVEPQPSEAPRGGWAEWRLPLLLFALTCGTTFFAGGGFSDALQGLSFMAPLMAILLAHEMGHYVAARLHRVDASPPYFLPFPIPPIGTLGAVIRMRQEIEGRRALLDVGASGPIAGMVVAIPVLVYGIATSPITALPEDTPVLFEGRNVLYLGLIYALKGPIPAGQDILLNGPAFAGWVGLLVTQINLIPVGQLDGGHVAYALLGKRQDRLGAWVHRALPWIGVAVGLAYGVPAYLAGTRGWPLVNELLAGVHWLVWAGILHLLNRLAGTEHPPVRDEPLGAARTAVAIGTLVLFALVFMPSWLRQG